MSLEFRSRGARKVHAFEKNTKAFDAIARSFEDFDDPEGLVIEHRDVLQFLRQRPGTTEEAFDLVLLDPPYKTDLGECAMKLLSNNGWLNRDAVVLLETDSRKDIPQCPAGLAIRSARRYGDTTLYIFDYSG